MTQNGTTPYLYRPIRAFGGRVLKCCGIATETSRAIVQAKADGTEKTGEDGTLLTNGVVVETRGYLGDRIYADTLEPYPTAAPAKASPLLTTQQVLALMALQEALAMATDAGLFDEAAAFTHPDRINNFCDDIGAFAKVVFEGPQD